MSVEGLRVRPGRPEDAAALREIRLAALADSPDAYGDTLEECLAWRDEDWAQRAATWYFYLAELDGRVVGMARGESHVERNDSRWLFAMFVAPAARGSGAATALIDVVSAWARVQGVDALHLYVTLTMERARAFYAKVGFVPTGETVTMHRDESIVLNEMRRDLSHLSLTVRRVDPAELYDLRRRVLRANDPDAAVANPADRLATSRHYAGVVGERHLVSATFFEGAAPFDPERPAYQLRYMATDFDVQGLGLGATTLRGALEDLAGEGVRRVWANARVAALDFYRREGWTVVADSFFVSAESGIDHMVIHRDLP